MTQPQAINSDLDIAKAACVLIGQGPIEGWSGDSKAISANLLYRPLVEDLISRRWWGFATQKVQLAQLVDAPLTQWKYAYQLPHPRIGDPEQYFNTPSDQAEPTLNWRRMGDTVLSDDLALYCDYRVDPGVLYWPAYFRRLVLHACAAEFALAMTDDQAKHDRHFQIAFGTPDQGGTGGLFGAAMLADSQTQTTRGLTSASFPLTAVRS